MRERSSRAQQNWQRTSVLGLATWLALSLAPARELAGAPQSAAEQSEGPRELTVERIYGQPSLSGTLTTGLQWSPDGRLLSYIQRSGQGRDAKTDIWAIDLASGERRVLMDSDKLQSLLPPPPGEPAGATQQQTGLGRLAPQRYLWSPKGDALLFVAQGQLFWFELQSQTGKRLTQGNSSVEDPKISPDGRWVSFVRDYELWVVEQSTGRERRLTTGGREELMNGKLDWVYPEELDIQTAYWWSPDSTQIAYLQMDQRPVTRYPLVNYLSYTGTTEFMRYPKAGDANPLVRVGVVALKGGRTRWLDIGRESDIYIPRVEWLRDSKRVAVQRLNRTQTKLDLLFADAASGRSSVVLSEEDPHWINLHNDLYFFSDGQRFLWSSERDGFRHLFLYDLSGKLVRRLTQGAWEVSGVARVDEKGGAIYFTATEKSPIERHLYRIGLDDTTATRLTREDGTHGINMAPDAAHYVDTYSNSMTPARQNLMRADGTRRHVVNENKVEELAHYGLSPVEFLTVRGADGTELHAMMIKPPDFNHARKYPVLIYTYGGPHSQIVRNAWGGANFLWHQMMAQKGFVVFGLDNRGMAGRGHAFETPIHRRMGEVELADQLAGVEYLKAQPWVDGARIGVWGWSYGGYMTLYALLNAPDVFKAGFAGAPVTDWRHYDTIYTERYMSRPQDNPEGYKQSAPATHAAKLKARLLIAHGTGDDNVHYANTVKLQEEFIRAGKYVDVMTYPGRGHGISDPPARRHLFQRVTQFFLDNL